MVEVTGYFTTTDNTAGFSPVTGYRVLDTRHGIGAPQAPIPAGGYLDISLAAAGIPTSATEVVVTATVYSAGNNYLNLAPPSAPNTKATSIAVPAAPPSGQPSTTTQITQTDGQSLRLIAGPTNALDVLLDVTGYFGAAQSGGGFTPLETRIYDSRNTGSTTVPANGTLSVPVLGAGTVPTDITKVGAVALNVTVDGPSSTGYLRAYADGTTEPTTIQTVTWVSGETTTNGTIINTTAPATGRVILRNFSTTAVKVVIDVQGYFAPYYNPDPGMSFNGGPGKQAFSHFTSFGLTDRDQLGVNEANGNGWYSAGDLHIAGRGLDLAVGRNYNSRTTTVGAFGTGWTMDAGGDIKLVAGAGSPALETLDGPTGYLAGFKPATGGGYTSPPRVNADLTVDSSQSPSGFKLTFHSSAEVWTFTGAGQLTSMADRNHNTISYTYNGGGQLTSITDTRGRTVTVTWTNSRVTQLADSTGRTWTYAYNAANQLVSVTDPTNAVTGYTYDPTSGYLASITNADGKLTSLTEDPNGRVLSVIRHADSGTNPEYDFTYETNRTKVTDPNSQTTLFLVDDLGRVTKVTDPLGHSQSVSYTTNSDVSTFTPATEASGGVPVTNSYSADGLNNLTKSELPTTATTAFGYTDPNNAYSPSKVTSPQGGSTTYAYDAKGNVASSTDSTSAAGQSTVTRNSDGQVATSTDANGNVTTDHYTGTGTAAGQLTSVDYPGPLGTVSFTYDSLSRVHTRVAQNGVSTTYGYDGDSRVTSVTTGSTTVTYTYDPAGDRTSLVDPSGTTTSTYDALGRITAETLSKGGTTGYTYDGAGNLLTLTDPSGTTHYHYNAVNLLDQLTDPAGGVTAFTYNADNERTDTTYPGGVQQVSTYDASDRLVRVHGISTANAGITDLTYSYATSTGADTDLRQSVLDNIAGKTTAYTYDALDRLTAATATAGGSTVSSYAYTYDKVGNLTTTVANGATTTAAFNAADQRCWSDPAAVSSPTCSSPPAAATTYAYDAAGDLTTTTPPTGSPTTSTFNAFRQTTTQGPLTDTYAGTSQGDRLTTADSSTGGQTYTFTQSILGLTTRQDTTTSTSDSYSRDTTGNLLGTASTTAQDYLTDGLGSVVATVTPTGAVNQRYAYTPYGQLTSTNTGDTNPYRYAGQYQDQPTGTYAIGARTLDPTTATWTQPDPSGQGSNPYAYAGDDPINETDPSGLFGNISFSVSACFVVCVDGSVSFDSNGVGFSAGAGVGVSAGVDGSLTYGSESNEDASGTYGECSGPGVTGGVDGNSNGVGADGGLTTATEYGCEGGVDHNTGDVVDY